MNPAAVNGVPNRPNPAYTQIAYFVSTGHRDQTQISTALNRRFKNNFQSGVTYTYMISMHDDGNIGYTAPGQNNQFDYLDGEYATSTDFQKHTLRAWTLYRMPLGDLGERVVLLRIGRALRRRDRRGRRTARPGTNRLNLTAAGGADQRDRHSGDGDAGQRRCHRHREPLPRQLDDRVGRDDSAQRAAGPAAAQGGSALDEGHRDQGHDEDLADRRGLQPVQPSQLRQLQRQPELDGAGDDGAVRPAAAEHGQRLHFAAGAVRVQTQLLSLRACGHGLRKNADASRQPVVRKSVPTPSFVS